MAPGTPSQPFEDNGPQCRRLKADDHHDFELVAGAERGGDLSDGTSQSTTAIDDDVPAEIHQLQQHGSCGLGVADGCQHRACTGF